MSDAGVVAIKNLILLCIYVGVVVLIGYLGYSQTKCTLVCYDTSELTFYVEGDLDPRDQMLYLNDYDDYTEITVNEVTYSINRSDQPIDSLNFGRNHIKVRSNNETTVKVSYRVQWKPVIERFHIAGLKVGEESDFFIYSENITQSFMRIEKENGEIVFNQTFNGSKIRIKMDEIGNYAVYMQVYGAGWSEMYYSEFTAFAGVTQIIDNVPLLRSKPEVPAYQTRFPVTIVREDCGVLLLLKRAANRYHRIIFGRLLPCLSYRVW
ncbi:MAG TPA: hypothetical protein EYP67_03095 [Methanosarcinales archaeon]|nr:hypothetical protein [Methanosarcinales archaeon]